MRNSQFIEKKKCKDIYRTSVNPSSFTWES